MDRVLQPPGAMDGDGNDDEAAAASLLVFRGGGEVRQFRGRWVGGVCGSIL
jgi:hypothetical protein